MSNENELHTFYRLFTSKIGREKFLGGGDTILYENPSDINRFMVFASVHDILLKLSDGAYYCSETTKD